MNTAKRNGRFELTYSQEEYEQLKKIGYVSEGVVYDYDLTPNGAKFILLRTPETTNEDIRRAKARLRSERDVVGFTFAYPETEEEAKARAEPSPEAPDS